MLNQILAILIVVMMILSFLSWALNGFPALVTDLSGNKYTVIPAVLTLGFWSLVAFRLYNCV